ncbi:hypothetical protein BJ165DRAFT_1529782 [Panaeolus papilionaceus]|nr:hypothetical protein BJ165DRAFT_1529782 [Panaeolus papilionaceus]
MLPALPEKMPVQPTLASQPGPAPLVPRLSPSMSALALPPTPGLSLPVPVLALPPSLALGLHYPCPFLYQFASGRSPTTVLASLSPHSTTDDPSTAPSLSPTTDLASPTPVLASSSIPVLSQPMPFLASSKRASVDAQPKLLDSSAGALTTRPSTRPTIPSKQNNISNGMGTNQVEQQTPKAAILPTTPEFSVYRVASDQTREVNALQNTYDSPVYTRFLEGIGKLTSLRGQVDVYAGGLDPDEEEQYAYAWQDDIGSVILSVGWWGRRPSASCIEWEENTSKLWESAILDVISVFQMLVDDKLSENSANGARFR